jgi:hypothetical protein
MQHYLCRHAARNDSVLIMRKIGGQFMVKRSLRTLPIAAATALSAVAFTPMASAEEAQSNLGPVGPNEPIIATIGDKRLIAYYEPDGDTCNVSAVVFDTSSAGRREAPARVQVALHPGDLFFLDGVDQRRAVLTCAPKAGMLTVLNSHELLTQAANVN